MKTYARAVIESEVWPTAIQFRCTISKKLEINYFKILTISFIIIFKWNYAINYGQTEVQKCKMYQRNLLYLAECQWDISDLPFVRNKGNQYQARYLKVELNASTLPTISLSEWSLSDN